MEPAPLTDGRAMVAAMDPRLDPETYAFCDPGDAADALIPHALGAFREAEGLTLILPRARAEAAGLVVGPALRRIVLTVHSSLEGVGLTAAVARALADEAIACNVVAALRHDHLFVPADQADRAMAALRRAQAAAQSPH